MTEGTQLPPGHVRSTGSPIKSGLLVISILLLAIIAVIGLIVRQGLVPDFLLPATPTPTVTSETEKAAPGAPSEGYASLVQTLTYGPLALTPTEEGTPSGALDTVLGGSSVLGTAVPPTPVEAPLAEAPILPSPTPGLDSCQYKIKEGVDDFLYSIYLTWRIHDQIPSANDFYTRITCAALVSNLKCNYQATDPDLTQPGWVLVLPGVTPEVCLQHGGTPLP